MKESRYVKLAKTIPDALTRAGVPLYTHGKGSMSIRYGISSCLHSGSMRGFRSSNASSCYTDRARIRRKYVIYL